MNYPNIPYPAKGYESATVKSAGCGPTCMSMVVENLRKVPYPVKESVRVAIACGARVSGGTDMMRLARTVAANFGLTLYTTDNAAMLAQALKNGAVAVANVGGDRSGYQGVFSDGGHYIVVRRMMPDGRLMILDPYLYDSKYTGIYRASKVQRVGNILFCQPGILDKDCENRAPRYYVFAKS